MRRGGGLFSGVSLRNTPITWDKMYGNAIPPVSYTNKPINETLSLKYSVVWACVTLIADAVSSLPFEAVRENDTGLLTYATLPSWVRKPHPELRRGELWGQLLLSLLLWGNAYALIIRRPSDGVIIGLRPLLPSDVDAEWDEGRPGYRRYRLHQGGPWLTSYDVFHLMGPSLPGAAKGLSVIAQARESVGLGLTLEEFGARYFAQGSMAKVVIKVPGKTMTSEQARDIVNVYERFHRGPGNWHRPAVLSGPTGTDIVNISIPPEDAQFLQSREFQASEITRWYRVPPHRVSLVTKTTTWGSGLAEENTAMVQHTFRPWIMRVEAALTSYLPGGEDAGLRIRCNDASLLRGSFKEQIDAWTSAVAGQLATPNEARRSIGLDPLPGGDELVAPAPAFGAPAPGADPTAPKAPAKPGKAPDKGGKPNGPPTGAPTG